ncbi:winged helix-turn-helix transcriptional regulator [bacterium]|nr:winged helix-turn-helix transcriptional regulator [bacterium]
MPHKHEPDPTEIFRVLGAERRLKIIKILRHHGPLGAMKIAELLGITTAAASQHLKALRIVGLVDGERHGYRIPYTLNVEILEDCCCEMNRACGVNPDERDEEGSTPDDYDELIQYKERLERKLRRLNEKISELKIKEEAGE